MSQMPDDELILLWRQGTSGEPDAGEVARLAARASTVRFDRTIRWRNRLENIVGFAFLAFLAWRFATGDHDAVGFLTFALVASWIIFLRWYHRDIKLLDPSSDGRAYKAAMLARIDKQIRLLGRVRWTGVPLALLNALVIAEFVWSNNAPPPGMTVVRWLTGIGLGLAIEAAIFLGIVWTNERSRWGIPGLLSIRGKIQHLYEE